MAVSMIRPAHCAMGTERARQLPLNLFPRPWTNMRQCHRSPWHRISLSLFFFLCSRSFVLSLSQTTHNLHTSDLLDAFVSTNRFRSDVTELRRNTSEHGVSKKKKMFLLRLCNKVQQIGDSVVFPKLLIYFTCPPAKELIGNGWKEEAQHI